jgi:tetratricopeptide (TPR) repeat protein
MRFLPLLFLTLIIFACKSDPKPATVIDSSGDAILDQMTADITDRPDNPNNYYTRAKYLYEVENYDRALQDMHKAMSIDSTNADYFHLISDIFLDYYKSNKALQAMNAVVELYPRRIPSLLKLCELELILQQHDNSIGTINKILKYDPQNAEAYFMLGMNFKELGNNQKAINSFQTAVENDPELIDGWLLLGELYELQKDTRALNFYNNAVEVDPQNITALHSKAYYLQNHGKIEEALEIYNDIIAIDLEYKDAHLNKGILYLEKKDTEKAYEEFNILCKQHPTYHLGFYYRGIVHELKSDTASAKVDYQNAINLKSDFVRAEEALAALKDS